jgi:hypothetical protein
MWMPVFRFGRRAPVVLHRELERNPTFFVDLVSLIYRAKDEESREVSKNERDRATIAYEVLQEWQSVPGLPASPEETLHWVREARRLLNERNREEIGDICIGHLLSASPVGIDGFWPHEMIRDLIEEIGSEELEQGISTGVYNARGVVTRSLVEGGGQERALADDYDRQAVTIEARWPRTGALLREIARGYRRDAHREDLDAELRDDE